MKRVFIIAGPNGSGKTILAKELTEELGLPFANADEIAIKLAPDGDVTKVRLRAGKLFLKKLAELIDNNESFVVETTLAGRYFLGIIERLKEKKYRVSLIYIFIESSQEAVNRIRLRVRKGGHPVAHNDVIRRFARSMRNFWSIYRDRVDEWKMFFSVEESFVLVAVGEAKLYNVVDEKAFDLFLEGLDTL